MKVFYDCQFGGVVEHNFVIRFEGRQIRWDCRCIDESVRVDVVENHSSKSKKNPLHASVVELSMLTSNIA